MEKVRQKAEELYNTFLSVLQENSAGFQITNPLVYELAKACCDKLINEATGNKEKMEFYRQVKEQIPNL